MFDFLKESHHWCSIFNLYNSAKFCQKFYNHPNKVLVATTRTGIRGFPKYILQKEGKHRQEIIDVRGTVKVDVLEGDDGCLSLIVTNFCETHPVNFLFMSAKIIKWIKKKIYIFDKVKKDIINSELLRLNINDDYNHQIGHVDVSDQLINHYRVDHWLKKTKWW